MKRSNTERPITERLLPRLQNDKSRNIFKKKTKKNSTRIQSRIDKLLENISNQHKKVPPPVYQSPPPVYRAPPPVYQAPPVYRAEKLPNVPIPNTLAIYIKCHGAIYTTTPIDAPKNITITKQNLGPFGCASYPDKFRKTQPEDQMVIDLLSGFNECGNESTYTDCFGGNENEVDKYSTPICTQNSCEIFTGMDKYLKKTYNIAKDAKKSILLITDKHQAPLSLFTCDETELLTFFNLKKVQKDVTKEPDEEVLKDVTKEPDEEVHDEEVLKDVVHEEVLEDVPDDVVPDKEVLKDVVPNEEVQKDVTKVPDDEVYIRNIKQFIEFRNRTIIMNRQIRTSDLFMLIKCARDKLNIENVNILDDSCNIILSGKKTERLDMKSGKMVMLDFGLPRPDILKIKKTMDRVGYGGKRKTRKIRRIKIGR